MDFIKISVYEDIYIYTRNNCDHRHNIVNANISMLLLLEESCVPRLSILIFPIKIINQNCPVLYFHQCYDRFAIHAINSVRRDYEHVLSDYVDINYVYDDLGTFCGNIHGLGVVYGNFCRAVKKISAAKARS